MSESAFADHLWCHNQQYQTYRISDSRNVNNIKLILYNVLCISKSDVIYVIFISQYLKLSFFFPPTLHFKSLETNKVFRLMISRLAFLIKNGIKRKIK